MILIQFLPSLQNFFQIFSEHAFLEKFGCILGTNSLLEKLLKFRRSISVHVEYWFMLTNHSSSFSLAGLSLLCFFRWKDLLKDRKEYLKNLEMVNANAARSYKRNDHFLSTIKIALEHLEGIVKYLEKVLSFFCKNL